MELNNRELRFILSSWVPAWSAAIFLIYQNLLQEQIFIILYAHLIIWTILPSYEFRVKAVSMAIVLGFAFLETEVTIFHIIRTFIEVIFLIDTFLIFSFTRSFVMYFITCISCGQYCLRSRSVDGKIVSTYAKYARCATQSSKTSKRETDCCLCYETFSLKDTCCVLSCGHVSHLSCYTEPILLRKNIVDLHECAYACECTLTHTENTELKICEINIV